MILGKMVGIFLLPDFSLWAVVFFFPVPLKHSVIC